MAEPIIRLLFTALEGQEIILAADLMKMCIRDRTMFTVIPLPCRWDDNARGMQLALLPVAGAIIGGLWALGVWIINLVNMPSLLGGALLVAIPNVMSGCIHLDGLMDTSDAIFSWRTLEERRRILKDLSLIHIYRLERRALWGWKAYKP